MKLYGDSSCARTRKLGKAGKNGERETNPAVPAARMIKRTLGTVRLHPKMPSNTSGAAKTITVVLVPKLGMSQKVGKYPPKILPTVKAKEMPPDTLPKCGFCKE